MNSKQSTTHIKNATIADYGLVNVFIEDGKISSISQKDEILSASQTYDLGGWLLLPAMAEPHAHLDKALTADQVPNPSGESVS